MRMTYRLGGPRTPGNARAASSDRGDLIYEYEYDKIIIRVCQGMMGKRDNILRFPNSVICSLVFEECLLVQLLCSCGCRLQDTSMFLPTPNLNNLHLLARELAK